MGSVFLQVMLPREGEGHGPAGAPEARPDTLWAASRHVNSPALPACPELVQECVTAREKALRQRAGVGSKQPSPLGVSAEIRAGRHPRPSLLLLDFSFSCAFAGSCHSPMFPLTGLVFPRLQPGPIAPQSDRCSWTIPPTLVVLTTICEEVTPSPVLDLDLALTPMSVNLQ